MFTKNFCAFQRCERKSQSRFRSWQTTLEYSTIRTASTTNSHDLQINSVKNNLRDLSFPKS